VVVDQYFYLLMSVLIALITAYGFGRSIGERLLHPALPRPKVLYVHAALFSGWVAFFIVQSALVRSGNVRWHRLTGWVGGAMGAVVMVVGIWTAITMARFDSLQLHYRYADLSLLISLYDMSAFAIPFGLAVYWRRKPELHRRLMLISMCALMAAAFGRFPIPPHVRPVVFFYAAVDLLLVVGMVRDLIVLKRAHPVYLWALAAFVVCQFSVGHAVYSRAALWRRVAHAILE